MPVCAGLPGVGGSVLNPHSPLIRQVPQLAWASRPAGGAPELKHQQGSALGDLGNPVPGMRFSFSEA